MPKKKTNEEFLKECKEKGILNKLKILEPYKGRAKKIKCECLEHSGVTFEITPGNLFMGQRGCPICAKQNRIKEKTIIYEEFLLKCKKRNISLDNLEIINDFLGMNKKVICRCKIHKNFTWEVIPYDLLMGHGCPWCSRQVEKDTLASNDEELFVERLEKMNFFKNYELLSSYNGSLNSVKIKCKKHNIIYETKPKILLKSVYFCCPECVKDNLKEINSRTNEEFDKILLEKESSVKRIGNYVNAHTKIECQCLNCNNIFYTFPPQLLENPYYCPYCSDFISFPNKLLRNLFNILITDFHKYEYNEKWCKKYRYDMYFILNKKEYIIECDGGFHFKAFDKTKKSTKRNKKIDKIKDELAKKQNIEVIRINCNEKTHFEIVEEFKKSKLAILFDLEKIDWNQLIKDSEKSLLIKVVNLFNNNPYMLLREIGKKCNVGRTAILNYLKIGTELGLCNYAPIIKKRNSAIRMFDSNNNFVKEFSGVNECYDYLKDILGNKYGKNYITNSCKNRKVTKREYSFKYARDCI